MGELGISANSYLFLFIIVLFGYFEQQITGFGATLFCLPFALMFLPQNVFTPVAWLFTGVQSAWIIVKDHKSVDYKYLVISLLLACTAGAFIGEQIVEKLDEKIVKIILATFIMATSTWNLIKGKKRIKSDGKHGLLCYLYPIGSGAFQATYGIGGPLLMAYLSKVLNGKDETRSTVAAYWLILNSFLLLKTLLTKGINNNVWETAAILSPAVLIGILVGGKVNSKIDCKHFAIIINCILILSALFILI